MPQNDSAQPTQVYFVAFFVWLTGGLLVLSIAITTIKWNNADAPLVKITLFDVS
jgi:hypothetical protein